MWGHKNVTPPPHKESVILHHLLQFKQSCLFLSHLLLFLCSFSFLKKCKSSGSKVALPSYSPSGSFTILCLFASCNVDLVCAFLILVSFVPGYLTTHNDIFQTVAKQYFSKKKKKKTLIPNNISVFLTVGASGIQKNDLKLNVLYG